MPTGQIDRQTTDRIIMLSAKRGQYNNNNKHTVENQQKRQCTRKGILITSIRYGILANVSR